MSIIKKKHLGPSWSNSGSFGPRVSTCVTGKPVDWWTLGILIYEMIVGYPPFVDEEQLLRRSVAGFMALLKKYSTKMLHEEKEFEKIMQLHATAAPYDLSLLQDPMGIYQKILAGKITFPKIFHKEAGIFPSGGWGDNRGVILYLWTMSDPLTHTVNSFCIIIIPINHANIYIYICIYVHIYIYIYFYYCHHYTYLMI